MPQTLMFLFTEDGYRAIGTILVGDRYAMRTFSDAMQVSLRENRLTRRFDKCNLICKSNEDSSRTAYELGKYDSFKVFPILLGEWSGERAQVFEVSHDRTKVSRNDAGVITVSNCNVNLRLPNGREIDDYNYAKAVYESGDFEPRAIRRDRPQYSLQTGEITMPDPAAGETEVVEFVGNLSGNRIFPTEEEMVTIHGVSNDDEKDHGPLGEFVEDMDEEDPSRWDEI